MKVKVKVESNRGVEEVVVVRAEVALVELLSMKSHRKNRQDRGGSRGTMHHFRLMMLMKSTSMMVVIEEMSWTMMEDMVIEDSLGNVEAVVVNVIKDRTIHLMEDMAVAMMVDMAVVNHVNLQRMQT